MIILAINYWSYILRHATQERQFHIFIFFSFFFFSFLIIDFNILEQLMWDTLGRRIGNWEQIFISSVFALR